MKRAVLFDLDGVLVDSRHTQLATLAGFATSALGRRVTIADLPTWAATTPREHVLAELGHTGVISQDGWDAATATATLTAEVFPFVADTLSALHAAGVATGIVTLRSRQRVHWLLPPTVRPDRRRRLLRGRGTEARARRPPTRPRQARCVTRRRRVRR